MRVALINGPTADGALFVREGRCTQRSAIWTTQWPPVTLAYLAAIALRDGHEVELFDCPVHGLSPKALLRRLTAQPPQLCVLAISTPTFVEDLQLAQAIKTALPAATIALLGVHATVEDLTILAAHRYVDCIIRHEPEETFRELLGALSADRDLAAVAGLSYREHTTERRNPDRPYIDDLNALPFPAWEKANVAAHHLPFSRRRFLILTPMRGCPYRCSFCTAGEYYGRRLRLRDVDNVIAEIRHDRARWGVDDFFMWAETFTIKRDFVLALSDAMIRHTPGIHWTCNSRTDTVDEEMLRRMRAAGCWMVSFGLESGSAPVLERAGKQLRPTDYRQPLAQARRAGLTTLGHFILGLPGDTAESICATIELALSLDLDFIQVYAAAPFVGSTLLEQAREEGLPAETSFAAFCQDKASLTLPGLSTGDLDRARRRLVRRFYLRPRILLALLRKIGRASCRERV